MTSDPTSVPGTLEEVLRMMFRSAAQEPMGHLRFLPFILKQDIQKFLTRLNSGTFRSNTADFKEYYLVQLERVGLELDAKKEPIRGDFALFPISGAVWCFCSIENSAVVKKTA